MSWTEEKIKKLKDLWGKGNTASQIAEIIGGGVSRNAVIGKAHRMNLSLKIKDNNINYKSNSQKSNENNKRVFSKGRKSKFRSFLIEKNFEPAKNLALEELTDNTCKYMDHDMHPNDPSARFCGRKTVSSSKQKFSYCPLHLMIIYQPKGKKEEIVDKEEDVRKFIEKKIKSA